MKYPDLLLGLDIGSSSIKASLVEVESGRCVATVGSPSYELAIHSPEAGFAEQDPESWWNHCIESLKKLAAQGHSLEQIKAIGISYQMHGLVLLDKNMHVLRPAIIWCDGRAVDIGASAFAALGPDHCLSHYLNSPGNFTASKLAWVKENEPEVFSNTHSFCLPGDFISYQLTGDLRSTPQGLSEAILWDFKNESLAEDLLEHYGISAAMVPECLPSLSVHGFVNDDAAAETGLPTGIPVSFKGGDQPVNAFALNVLEPGEVAANAGTSGVVYAVSDTATPDRQSRVNSFLHVTHATQAPRVGVLLCVNGTGIMNSWARKNFFGQIPYEEINALAASVAPGSDGLYTVPYGNGAERSLENRAPGAAFTDLSLTRHDRSTIARSIQEGIVFSLKHGLEVMEGCGVTPRAVRAGKANLFLSPVFREAFVNTSGIPLELYNTDGSQGAARGAGLGAAIYSSSQECFKGLQSEVTIEPELALQAQYEDFYSEWKEKLLNMIGD
jgi:xylulokinase